MENINTNNSPSFKKSLSWPSIIGFAFGLFSIAANYLDASASPMVKFYVWFLTVVPLLPIIMIIQPIIKLEGKQTMYYVLASPIIWAIIGLFVGYIIYRIRLMISKKNQFSETPPSGEKKHKLCYILLPFIIIIILATTFFFLYQNFATKNKRIEKKVADNPVQVGEEKNQIVDSNLNKLADTAPDEQSSAEEKEKNDRLRSEILSNLKWKHYSNKAFDISFDYPDNWKLDKPEYFQPGEFYLKITKTDEIKSDLMPDVLDLRFLGTQQNFVPEHPDNIVGSCAYEYKNINEFCQSGCTHINDWVAIDFRNVNHGEPIASLVGYSTASKIYPRLCFEMTIDELLRKISSEKNISMDELQDDIDLNDEQKDQQSFPEIFEALTIFRHTANSLTSFK
jgi:hypothetical protein